MSQAGFHQVWCWAAAALAGCGGMCAPAAGQWGVESGGLGGGEAEPLATVRLVSETESVEPGGEVRLGVVFEMRDGWHLYWRNSGDSGAPPSFTLDLPEGVTAGDVQWPAPKRSLHGGGMILDYVYEGVVTLVVPLRVGDGVPAGETLSIGVSAEWLVCDDDVCLPGDGEATLELPVATGEATADSRWRSLFAATDARTPQYAPPAGVTVRWEGDRLLVGAEGAGSLTFFPLTTGVQGPRDAAGEAHAEAEGLSMGFRKGTYAPGSVLGVLEVRGGPLEGIYTIWSPAGGAG